jgi:hypothetical protein
MQSTSFRTKIGAGYIYIYMYVYVNEPFGSAKHGAFLSQKHVISSQEGLPSAELHGFRRAKQRNLFCFF